MLCLVAYRNGENVQTFQFVFISHLMTCPHLIPSVETSPEAGNAFTASCNDWKDGTYSNFNDWALKQFDLKELDSDDEGEVPVHLMKAKDIIFERKKTGEFILPPMSNYKTVRQKQRVVRGYIGAVYRQSIHSIFIIPFPYHINRRLHWELKSSIPL